MGLLLISRLDIAKNLWSGDCMKKILKPKSKENKNCKS